MIKAWVFKNKTTLLVLAVLIVILGIVLFFEILKQAPQEHVLTGRIVSIDIENNFLIIQPTSKNAGEIKILVVSATKFADFETPFNQNDPPAPGTQFTPVKTETTFGDLRIGDEIFIESSKNIAGKNIIDNIKLIQVLP